MKTRKWAIAALGCVATVLVTLWVCMPVLEFPQLEPDDFRYLSILQDLATGKRTGLMDACIVENRWDHLWFTETDAIVRFFRPTVLLSYWIDTQMFVRPLVEDPQAAFAVLLRTNIALQLGCALLVLVLLLRVVDAWAAVLGSVLFASFACHAETIWYVAGRTDTLAALGFLAALALHVHGDRLRALRWLALPAFAFALVTKELTIALPILCVLWDLWGARRAGSLGAVLRRDRWLWLAYLAIVASFWTLRTVVLGGATGSDLGEPYFVAPLSAAFPLHLVTESVSYAANAAWASITAPFATWQRLPGPTLVGGLVAIVLFVGLAGWSWRRSARARVFVAFALLTWAPTSFVYVSERYLYLPSVALACLVAIAASRKPRVAIAALVLVWSAHQAHTLHWKHTQVAGYPRSAIGMGWLIRGAQREFAQHRNVLCIHLPIDVVHAQFLEEQVRVELANPMLTVRTASLLDREQPYLPPPIVRQIDAHTIELTGHPLIPNSHIFRWLPLEAGRAVHAPRLGFQVRVLEGSTKTCSRIRIRFDEPLSRWTILRFQPGPPQRPGQPIPDGARIRQGALQLVRIH